MNTGKKRVGFIGAGNMGEALIKGILSGRLLKKNDLIVSDKEDKRRLYIRRKYGIRTVRDNLEVVKRSDILILAIKPQDARGVLSVVRPALTDRKLVISLMAGIRTKYIEGGGKIRVVRVMPNAPALVGSGIAAVSPGSFALKKDVKLAKSIFACVGEVIEIEESLLDIVTALSGSGPAYLFYLVEALASAGVKRGLKKETALRLACQTAFGSGKMLNESSFSLEQLIKKVASKGGTTEAALKVFESQGLRKIIEQGVRAAEKRAKQLSK